MSHVLNCTIRLERKVEAEGQVRIWMLSSFGALQIGQFEWGRCFLLFITTPDAISFPINFEINFNIPNLAVDLLSL